MILENKETLIIKMTNDPDFKERKLIYLNSPLKISNYLPLDLNYSTYNGFVYAPPKLVRSGETIDEYKILPNSNYHIRIQVEGLTWSRNIPLETVMTKE